MKISRVVGTMLGATLFAVATSAMAADSLLLIMPVEGSKSDAAAALEFQRALLSAFQASEGFAVATGDALVGERTADRFRESAERAGAAAIVAAVVEKGSVALELRSGHSGGVITTWSIDAADAELGSVVRETQLVVAAQSQPEVRRPGRNSDGTSDSAPDPGSDDADESLLASVRSDAPIQIRSDQLDVATKEGQRHLLFRRNVVVEQGDIELRSNRLDAFYNEGDSQPVRLVAQREVEVVQGDRVASCDVATYLRSDQKVVCKGHARLVQGCDVVRGEQLEFDLKLERFRVVGAASVVIAQGDSCPKVDVEAGL